MSGHALLDSTKLRVPLLEEIPRKCATSLAVAQGGRSYLRLEVWAPDMGP